MSDVVIRVEGLGKEYCLGEERARYQTLRDRLTRPISLLRRAWQGRPSGNGDGRRFWALRDVSFEVKQGEVLGIIGRNGAGKSTLLKILSQITEPTEGGADITGRVGSLLEVGTGFHPELTGRENVYLNGAILGMKTTEIALRFDAIVAFAEVEKFIDTPVKYYSSGMYMRLAFAVAAHLEPEVLVVDEVLAVGDAAFQKKCLGKMGEAARGGRTVLFVSHNMSAVSGLCSQGLLLDAGRVRRCGPLAEVVTDYLGLVPRERVTFAEGPLKEVVVRQVAEQVEIVACFQVERPLPMACLGFVIADATGQPVCGTNPRLDGRTDLGRGQSRGTVTVRISNPQLRPGRYRLSVWFGDGVTDYVGLPDCLSFEQIPVPGAGFADPRISGCAIPVCSWEAQGEG